MAGLSDTFENRALDWILVTGTPTRASGTWLALYTAAPTDSTAGTEVTNANAYARQAVTFNAASGGATANAATVTWPAATGSWGTIVAVAVVDSATHGAGNVIAYGTLTSQAIVATNVYEILAGELDITLD
jgi:hypothetical protein